MHFEMKVTLCFEIQKNSMNNIINISEDSLQVTLFKQAKSGAYEIIAILSFLSPCLYPSFYLTNPL